MKDKTRKMQAVFQSTAELIEFPDWLMNAVGEKTYAVFQVPLTAFDSALHAALPDIMGTVDAWAVGDTQHPLSKKMPLLSNPSYVLFALVAYMAALGFLYFLGKVTGPMKVKFISNIHNAFLFLLSSYMCGGIFITAIASGFSLWANPVGPTTDPNTWRLAKLVWLFYVSKLPEFGDTFIMMVKQNYRQVSFLHLYHHSTIFAIWYIVVSRAPGGESYFSAMLNSGVHVVMYGYYWGTAIFSEGTAVRSFLNNIKFYITKMQMFQFFLNCCQSVYDLWIVKETAYPAYLLHLLLWYMCTLLALFGNFLIQNSGKGKKSGKASSPKPASPTAAESSPAKQADTKPVRSPSPKIGKKKSA
jgi:elongation of very long chain fatty acids protein 4